MGDGGAGALERGVEVAVPCAAAEPHDAGRGIDYDVFIGDTSIISPRVVE